MIVISLIKFHLKLGINFHTNNKTMNKYFSLVVIICFAFKVDAQQTYPIKETYDQILERYYAENSGLDYNNSANAWWAGWDPILSSYLKMFEATKDKAYLNKFVKHSYGLQMRRSSVIWDGPMNSRQKNRIFNKQNQLVKT